MGLLSGVGGLNFESIQTRPSVLVALNLECGMADKISSTLDELQIRLRIPARAEAAQITFLVSFWTG